MKTPVIDLLIVEDVDTMRSLLGHVFGAMEGFRVTGLAANGWEARVELTRRRPGLVLLDEVLPGESSLDLLVEIQAQGIPVFMITGMEDPAHQLPAGVLGRLLKPGWDTVEEDKKRLQAALSAYSAQPLP